MMMMMVAYIEVPPFHIDHGMLFTFYHKNVVCRSFAYPISASGVKFHKIKVHGGPLPKD